MAGTFLSGWGKKPARPPEPAPPPEPVKPAAEAPASIRQNDGEAISWSSWPSLEKVHRNLEEQQRVIDEVRRYLEARLRPFQKYLAAQERGLSLALRHLEAKLAPVKEYLRSQEQSLARVGQALDQAALQTFESFGRYLAEHLQRSWRFLEEQPKPFHRYLADQQRAVELVFKDLEEKLEWFDNYLREQQKILDAIAQPHVLEQFEVLVGLMDERQKAINRFAQEGALGFEDLFAELDRVHHKFRALDIAQAPLIKQILDEARASDDRLREALRTLPRMLREELPGMPASPAPPAHPAPASLSDDPAPPGTA
jgi:hypothetical protein